MGKKSATNIRDNIFLFLLESYLPLDSKFPNNLNSKSYHEQSKFFKPQKVLFSMKYFKRMTVIFPYWFPAEQEHSICRCQNLLFILKIQCRVKLTYTQFPKITKIDLKFTKAKDYYTNVNLVYSWSAYCNMGQNPVKTAKATFFVTLFMVICSLKMY